MILGRSDATLNAGGVRIGTAEIYRIVDALPEVAESVVIGQRWQRDTRVVLFVRLAPGFDLNRDLENRIRKKLREDGSPRHVPALILAVEDIPRTRSGKISELAVRAAVNGDPIRNIEALANPESLEQFRQVAGPRLSGQSRNSGHRMPNRSDNGQPSRCECRQVPNRHQMNPSIRNLNHRPDDAAGGSPSAQRVRVGASQVDSTSAGLSAGNGSGL